LTRVVFGDPCAQMTSYCACAVKFVAFTMGENLLFRKNMAESSSDRPESDKVNSKIGVRNFKMWIIFASPWSNDTAHAQCIFLITDM